jgi:hypothetical protein
VIRRLLVATAVVFGATALLGGTAGAADVACVYQNDPLHLGLCVSL